MNRLFWGVATSIFPDRFNDPSATLMWAKINRFDPVQIYLNRILLSEPSNMIRIAEAIQGSGRRVMFHLPDRDGYPGALLEKDLGMIRNYFKDAASWFEHHAVIWHFRPGGSIRNARKFSEQLTGNGFISCPETVLESNDAENAVDATRRSQMIWRRHETIPVLDVSRMFTIDRPSLSLRLTLRWIRIAGMESERCIVHLIDARKNPVDHSSWCAPEHGTIPWRMLLNRFRSMFASTVVVFEYENPEHSREARDWFERSGINSSVLE